MPTAKQIHAFLEVSELFLRQSRACLADDTLPLSSWPREEASAPGARQSKALCATRRLETPLVSAPDGETDLTIERNSRTRSTNMLANANLTDPWMQTIDLLSVLTGETDTRVNELAAVAALHEREACPLPVMGQRYDVRVQLLERPTQSTVTIAWRDSTHCFYGDQVWHATRARLAGVCVMSGRAIVPGDAIYRPRPCRPTPLNSGAMILRSVLNDALTYSPG